MHSTPHTPGRFSVLLLAAALLLASLAAGCDHDPVGDRPGHSSFRSVPSSSIVGTWRLVSAEGAAWYAHFASDGTWKITDDQAGSARRVHGTYTASGNRFSGPMVNPGVGQGKIEGYFEEGAMTMDFVEYWHSPAKHVAYDGTKL